MYDSACVIIVNNHFHQSNDKASIRAAEQLVYIRGYTRHSTAITTNL